MHDCIEGNTKTVTNTSKWTAGFICGSIVDDDGIHCKSDYPRSLSAGLFILCVSSLGMGILRHFLDRSSLELSINYRLIIIFL